MEKHNNAETAHGGEVGKIETIEDVAAAIAALYVSQQQRPDEVSITEMMAQWGCSRGAARGRLERLVEAGRLEKRRCNTGGALVVVYRRVDNEQ